MIRIVEFLIAVGIVLVIFVVVGLALPSHRHVENTVETSRPLPVVFDMMSSFKRFQDWAPLHGARYSVSGPENGEGAQVDYVSSDLAVGKGSWHVSSVVPGESITIAVTNNDYGSDKKMTFKFKKAGNQKLALQITQVYDVDYGFNLFGRYAGLYVTRSVGDPMKAGLNTLNNLLATIPKYDYTQLAATPKVVNTPAENLLIAPSKSKRDNTILQATMTTQEKWLHQVMEKNGLEAAGPLRVITEDFGADVYSFDLAIPVKKTGAPAAAAGAAPPQLDVKIDNANGDNPVKYVQTQAGSAVTTVYAGHMAQLPVIHEMIKAWTNVHAVTLGDKPYDTYNKGIDTSFQPEGDFTIYWPLKAASAGK